MSEVNFTKDAWLAYNEKIKKSFSNSPDLFKGDYSEWIKIQTNVPINCADMIQFKLSASSAGVVDSVIQWDFASPNKSYAYNTGSVSIKEVALGIQNDYYVFWINFDSSINSIMIECSGIYQLESIYNIVNTITATAIDGESLKLSETGFIGGLEAYSISIAKESDMSEVIGKSYSFKFLEDNSEISLLTINPEETKTVTIKPTDNTGNLEYLLLKVGKGITADLNEDKLTISAAQDGTIVATSTIDSSIYNSLQIIVL